MPDSTIVSKEYSAGWVGLTNQQKEEAHDTLFADRIPLQFPTPEHLIDIWTSPQSFTEAESDGLPSRAILVTMAPRASY